MTGPAGYYRVSEAAALLRVSSSTVWRWIKSGKLPAQRVGPKTIRIKKDALAAILKPVAPEPADGAEAGLPSRGEMDCSNGGSTPPRNTKARGAEEELKLYQQIFAHANDAIAVIDPQGVYLEQNAAHQALIGYSDEELQGRTPSIHLGEEAFSILAETLKTTGTYRDELVSRTKSGEQIPIELSAFTMRDADGEIVCHVGIKRDVRARKWSEDLLNARMRQQAAVAELGRRALIGLEVGSLMNEITNVVSQTLDVEYVKILELLPNGKALRLRAGVGWHEGLVGQATVDAGVDSQAGYTLISRTPVIVEDLRAETRFHGPPLLLDHQVVSGLSVLIGDPEQPFGVLGAHTTKARRFSQDDVHFLEAVANILATAIERQRTEERHRYLAAIVESSQDAIIGKNLAGIITSWNPAAERMYGYTAAETIGQPITLLCPPDQVNEIPVLLARIKRGERIEHYETVRRRKDGRILHVSLTISPIRDRSGQIVGASKIARDITDQKAAELEQRVSERRLELALEAGRMGAWDWNMETGQVVWSPNMEVIHGLAPGSFGGSFDDVVATIHPGDRDRVLQDLRTAVEQRTDYHTEYRNLRPDGKVQWLEARGQTVALVQGQPTRMIGICADVTERRQTEEAERFLAQASAILASTLDYETTIGQIARLVVPTLADWCTVDILEQGYSRCVAAAHIDPAKEGLLWDLRRHYPLRPDGRAPGSQVLRTGESVFYPWFSQGELPQTTQDAGHLRLVTALSPVSAMAVPMTVQGKTIGVMTLSSVRPERRLTQRDLRLAEELAGRAAIAIDNARLYRAERQARADAEQATARTEQLQSLTAALSAAVTPAEVADAIINEGVAALGATAGSVMLLTDDRAALEVVKAIGYPPEVLDPRRCVPIEAPLPLAESVRTGSPVLLDSQEAYARYPGFTDLPGWRENRATAALPLVLEGRAVGALGMSFAGPHEFNEHDRTFMETLSQQCSQALERARLYEAEREARFTSEAAQAQLAFIAEASRILATSLDYETTLTTVTNLAVPHLADWCAIDLLTDEGSVRRLAVAHSDPEKVEWAWELQEQYPYDPDATTGLARVLRTGEPVFVPEVTEAMVEAAMADPGVRDVLQEINLTSVMIVPLVARGRMLGAITFIAAESKRHYDQADLAFAQDLAGRAALAVESARLYREARQAIHLREEFLSIASHELKTPLTTVKTYSQLLARQLAKPALDRDRLQSYSTHLQRQLERLEILVADLLDASRIQQGRLELRPELGDLREIAQQVLARFEGSAERTEQHRLVLDAPAPVAGLWDHARLDQVLTNLVSNALKYSPEGGEVRLAIQQVDHQTVIEVHDQGIGIPADDQSKLFQPFVRGDIARGTVSGTGLGLYITRQIVEQHGGTISVDSELGRGTTFTVQLPHRSASG